MAPKQQSLPLSTSLRAVFAHEGDLLLSVVREVIQSEVKQADDFAVTVDASPSHLSMALNGNGRNFDLRWLPAVLHVDRRRRVVEHVAALIDCKVVEREPLTDAAKLKLLRAELERGGADIHAIERRAYEEDFR